MESTAFGARFRKELNEVEDLTATRVMGKCEVDFAEISDEHRLALLEFAEIARYEEVGKPKEWCWLWPDNKLNPQGYGIIWSQSDTRFSVHRLSFEWFKGRIPDGFVVMHDCDQPACWNPDHLFLGTQAENMQDMVRKGRARKPKKRKK